MVNRALSAISKIGSARSMAAIAASLFAFGLPATVDRVFAGTFLTPEDAIETSRILQAGVFDATSQGPVSVSPDRTRYVFRTVRGDVSGNRTVTTIYEGRLDSLKTAAHTRPIAVLYSSGLGSLHGTIGPHDNTDPNFNPIRWKDNFTITMISADRYGINQLMSINVLNRNKTQLTHGRTAVSNYEIGSNGIVLYASQSDRHTRQSNRMLREGFSIRSTTDAFALVTGSYNGDSFFDDYWDMDWWLQKSNGRPIKLVVGGQDHNAAFLTTMAISPDCRFAIISATGAKASREWTRYGGTLGAHIAEATVTPGNELARLVGKLYVIDLSSLKSRPVWDAPFVLGNERVIWSPDSTRILITSAFLPLDRADRAGLDGTAAAIVTVANGASAELPVSLPSAASHAEWSSTRSVELETTDGRGGITKAEFTEQVGGWVRSGAAATVETPRLKFELRQSLSDPPVLFVVDTKRSETQLIFDPNRELRERYDLGAVRYIVGTMQNGDTWEGWVFYPTGYAEGRRYPLVIQSDRGLGPENIFSLYGDLQAGLGPPLIATDVARSLASRQILTVQLKAHFKDNIRRASDEGELFRSAYEAVIANLDSAGLIDPQKVGLSGFSREGYHVEYALTHSTFHYATAVAADNWDAGYMTAAFLGWDFDSSEVNGAAAYGKGLEIWLKSAPPFLADQIHSPLMIELQSGGTPELIAHWEMFSRLRDLKYPVEMWIAPDYFLGSHNTQNPRQIIAIQHHVIDWFDFWLNGHESPSPTKSEQYARWEQLCDQQISNNPGQPTSCVSPKR